MKNTIASILAFTLAAGCGDFADQDFEEIQLGTATLAASVKFPSPAGPNQFSYGFRFEHRERCKANTSNTTPCYIPGNKNIVYTLVGADSAPCPTCTKSWHFEVRRGFEILRDGHMESPPLSAGGWTFGEVTGAAVPFANVRVQTGTCPNISGNPFPGQDPQNSMMQDYVCIGLSGPSTVLSESFNGVYRKFTGVYTITLDMNKIGTVQGDKDQLLEHAVQGAIGIPVGMGWHKWGRVDIPAGKRWWSRSDVVSQFPTPLDGFNFDLPYPQQVCQATTLDLVTAPNSFGQQGATLCQCATSGCI